MLRGWLVWPECPELHKGFADLTLRGKSRQSWRDLTLKPNIWRSHAKSNLYVNARLANQAAYEGIALNQVRPAFLLKGIDMSFYEKLKKAVEEILVGQAQVIDELEAVLRAESNLALTFLDVVDELAIHVGAEAYDAEEDVLTKSLASATAEAWVRDVVAYDSRTAFAAAIWMHGGPAVVRRFAA